MFKHRIRHDEREQHRDRPVGDDAHRLHLPHERERRTVDRDGSAVHDQAVDQRRAAGQGDLTVAVDGGLVGRKRQLRQAGSRQQPVIAAERDEVRVAHGLQHVLQLLPLVGDGHGIDGALQGGEFHGVLVVRARAHAADAHLEEVGKRAVEPVRRQRFAHGVGAFAVGGEGIVERVCLGSGGARGRNARAEAAQRRKDEQGADRQRPRAVDDRLLDLAEVKYPQFARAVSAPGEPVDDDTQPVKQQQCARQTECERARHVAQTAPRVPADGKRVRSGEQRDAQHERRGVDGGGALLFRALGRLGEQRADLLAHDLPTEDE